MARWCLFWLIWVGALPARANEGLSYDLDSALTCPTPTQLRVALEAQLEALPWHGKRDWLDRHTLKVSPAADQALKVELVDSLSRVSFRRFVPRGSCQAQAEAVALLTLSWLDQSTSLPEPAIASPVATPELSSAPERISSPPVATAPRSGWHPSFEPRLGIGGLLASTPSPLGASVEASLQLHVTRRLGVAARAAWFTPLHAADPDSPGSFDLRRYAIGCDLSWTGKPLPSAMDIALGIQDEIDQVAPEGYARENPSVTQTPQVRLAVLYRCSDGLLTPGTCDGLGLCVATAAPSACLGNLTCTNDGTACKTECAETSDCLAGFYCGNAEACLPLVASGPCTEDGACRSGICGFSGSGNCCNARCTHIAPPCGATACDGTTGACIFPGTSTSCAPASCTGTVQTNPTSCDGSGNCPSSTTDCSPYTCGADACLASCTSTAECASGYFCDATSGICCSGLASGGTMAVDTVAGSDSAACCGVTGKRACQTLGHAMQLIDSAQAQDVTLDARVNGAAGGIWSSSAETFPVVLGWGAELNARGISFDGPMSQTYPAIFRIAPYSAQDALGYASIAGLASSPVEIGLGQFDSPTTKLEVDTGATLYLANAKLGNAANGQEPIAILVRQGAALMLGQDHSGAMTGTVFIGAAQPETLGWIGISCQGCTIEDAPLSGQSSVVIQGQIFNDIQAEDDSVITLRSAPVIGTAPARVSFNTCTSKYDGRAVLSVGGRVAAVALEGTASMTFDNGTVQCISGDGFDLTASARGTPTLELTHSIIQNTQQAIFASAGSATLSSSTIRFNNNGVQQATDGTHVGTINLGGQTDGGPNTVACSSQIESIFGPDGGPGIGVLNATSSPLNADNVAWDTTGPDVFNCDSALSTCTCATGSCTDSPGADGMDAVAESTGALTTSGNSLSALDCTPLCAGACFAGYLCCGVPPNVTCAAPGRACND